MEGGRAEGEQFLPLAYKTHSLTILQSLKIIQRPIIS